MSHATVFDVVDCSACKFAGRKDDYFLVTMAANKEFVVEEDAQFATFDMAFSPDGAKMLATHSLAYLAMCGDEISQELYKKLLELTGDELDGEAE